MGSMSTPSLIVLRGFDASGAAVYEQQFSRAESPEAEHLWEDPEFIRLRHIARLVGDLFDETGQLEQHYDRQYDEAGQYRGGTINYSDGRELTVNKAGLEPSSVPHGPLTFTVHYVHNLSNPQAPTWFALSLVVFDASHRIYPAEYVHIPEGQRPPALQGSGATQIDAYWDLRDKILAYEAGVMRKA